jgi:hypothetical protein
VSNRGPLLFEPVPSKTYKTLKVLPDIRKVTPKLAESLAPPFSVV